MTRRRKERAVGNSMSCTDEEWARIRMAASAAGEGIGRHVVRRCLTDDPSPNARPRASQALSPGEQREMHDAVIRLDAGMTDTDDYAGSDMHVLGSAIRMMCEDRILVMESNGRSDELHAVLRQTFGEDAEPAIAEFLDFWMDPDGEGD